MLIEEASLLQKKTTEVFISPVFFSKTNENIRWRIHIYPSGNTAETQDFFGLFIERIPAEKDFPVMAKYKLTLHKNDREVHSQSGFEEPIEFSQSNGTTRGWNKLVRLDKITSIQGQSDQLKICLQLVYEAKRNWETTSTPIR